MGNPQPQPYKHQRKSSAKPSLSQSSPKQARTLTGTPMFNPIRLWKRPQSYALVLGSLIAFVAPIYVTMLVRPSPSQAVDSARWT